MYKRQISGYKTRLVVQAGPYSMCRNPLYLFSAIGLTGIGLCSATLTIPLVMVVFFALYYPWIIFSEEMRLTATHSEHYLAYRMQTPSLRPRFAGLVEPETYTVFPRILRRNIADSFWFIFLAATTHAVSELESRSTWLSLW